MKKYLKYKEFIPINFVENKIKSKTKGDNTGVNILIIANILLLPMNCKLLFETKEVVNDTYIENKYINKDEIEKWINLESRFIEKIKVENNMAEIILTNNNSIKELEDKGIKIKKYSVEEDLIKTKVIYEN